MTFGKTLRLAIAAALWVAVAVLAWRGMWIPFAVLLAVAALVVVAFAWPALRQRGGDSQREP